MPAVLDHTALRVALDAAHDASARRGNISSEAVRLAAFGSGSLTSAIAAALMTLGGVHGPLVQTQELLESPDPLAMAAVMFRAGLKVPGWGNSFVKGHEDPLWLPVREQLDGCRPDILATIDGVTDFLCRAGCDVYPNPSAYTAACAMAMGIPAAACPSLFIAGRLAAWTEIFLLATKGGE